MKYYITTSIAYTNADPHIGFALELLQADLLARYHRNIGKDVYFLTGTDEHGSKIARTAEEKGVPVEEFVEGVTKRFVDLTLKLNISNSDFIRTTDRERHWPGVDAIWEELKKSGDIYKDSYVGLYCSGCEEFKREKDLVEGKCANHDKPLEEVREENYFFRLSRYSDQIKKLIESDRVRIVPKGRKKEVLSFLKEGAEDISVSRSAESLKWGIPVPGDESQTLYVWVDALTNYISALGYGRNDEDFENFWPADVHCIGKDILRFHAVIWIGMLLSAGIELPRDILVHGFITAEGRKMSKSLGNVIDPFALVDKFGVDPVRYFFLREIPVTSDGDFSEERFIERYNGDLADGLGNLLARSVSLAKKKNVNDFVGRGEVKEKVEEVMAKSSSLLEEYKFNEALENIWSLVHFADRYIEEKKPWEGEQKEVIENLLYILFSLSDMLSPFLPQTAEEIKKQVRDRESRVLFPKI